MRYLIILAGSIPMKWQKHFLGILIIFYCIGNALGAPENLDELIARKARLATNSWGKTYVENPTTFVWQPETMTYTDIETGSEVWRISSTNGIKNSLPDISWAHWSADGKRFSFGSHRDTSANNSTYETYDNSTYQGAVMMMRADGRYLRPADNAPFEVYVHARYLHWSPVEPDVYYGFGRNYAGENLSPDKLYKVTVSDTGISKQLILDFKTGSETDLSKAISADGTKILAKNGGKFYPATLLPSPVIDDTDGWAAYRQLDDYWGNTPTDTNYGFHDGFLLGTGNNIQRYFIPEGFSSWWKVNLSGSASDGGPVHIADHTAPYNWGEIEPVLTGFASGGKCGTSLRSPWNCDSDPATGIESYLSHPGFDRWGRYVAGVNSQQYKGHGVWDLQNHSWVDPNIPMVQYNWHNDWEAWSDYFASSPSGDFATSDNLYTHKYDGTDSINIASTHARESGSNDYNSLPRVTQSPDGTKLVYHSDFLYNTANTWDVFYAVAYYPHPPEITGVTGTETYTIRFDWRTNQALSRGYTNRGWPNETINDPPPPRETKSFRLWRSANQTTWTPITIIDANIFSRYNFRTGEWIGNNYWTFTDTPGTGIFYYAVTAVEHSGLESRTLSNIFNTAGKQVAEYPHNPKTKSAFYLTLPKSPAFSVTKQTVPGQYRLTWTEPADPMIRYYNIYYSNLASPLPIQKNRIASIPVGINTYLDWLADSSKEAFYFVSSVDFQGNESPNILSPLKAPEGFSVR